MFTDFMFLFCFKEHRVVMISAVRLAIFVLKENHKLIKFKIDAESAPITSPHFWQFDIWDPGMSSTTTTTTTPPTTHTVTTKVRYHKKIDDDFFQMKNIQPLGTTTPIANLTTTGIIVTTSVVILTTETTTTSSTETTSTSIFTFYKFLSLVYFFSRKTLFIKENKI